METVSPVRRYLPAAVWAIVILAIYFVYTRGIAPQASGISLTGKMVVASLKQIGTFVLAILGGLALIEVYTYQIFFRKPRSVGTAIPIRIFQIGIAILILVEIVAFLDLTDFL